MKVGLFINTQFPEGFNLAERVPEMVAQVRAARDAGFSSLWFPHHWLTHPLQMLQITPVMGYVAAHAQDMTIGPNILILPPLMQTYRAALKEYGRTAMEFPITIECYAGANHATAHEECRGPLEYKYNAYASWGLEDRTSVSFEDFARDRFIIGDKVSVREEIARYRELLGVDHFIMRCQWPGLPQQQVLGSIQRLGEIFA